MQMYHKFYFVWSADCKVINLKIQEATAAESLRQKLISIFSVLIKNIFAITQETLAWK